MQFKVKLRRIGNSQGVYIPKNVITGYNIGDVITLVLENKVITSFKEPAQSTITEERVIKDTKKLVFNVKTGQNEWK